MPESFLQFESSNIQNILIALVVICAIVYAFIEFKKIHTRFQELEEIISRLGQALNTSRFENNVNTVEVTDKKVTDIEVNDIEVNDIEILKPDDSIITNIIDQVEESLEHNKPNMMGGLFISVNSIITDGPIVDEAGVDEACVEKITKIDDSERIVELNDIVDGVVDGVVDGLVEPLNETNYEEYTIKDLKTILEDMELSISGNKSKLIERINSNKK